jgi:hypothetical protein
MQPSPIFWFGAGVLSVWAYHRWVKPMPSTKA